MAAAVVSVPAAEVIGHRYARRAIGGERIGHLLTRGWEQQQQQPGRGQPAICGARAQKWRAVELFGDAGAFRNCPDCTTAAGLDAPRQPVRIAPDEAKPTAGRIVGIDFTPVEHLTQSERTQRRAAFRDSFAPKTTS